MIFSIFLFVFIIVALLVVMIWQGAKIENLKDQLKDEKKRH